MDRTLREHILRLQYRIQELSDAATAGLSPDDRERIVSEKRTANLALRLYVKAYDMEQKIAARPKRPPSR